MKRIDSSQQTTARQGVTSERKAPATVRNSAPSEWECLLRRGPVLATAIHMGHLIRPALQPYLFADDEVRRRDEDPLTGMWAGIGDAVFRTQYSRFEVDLNRSRQKAFSIDPADTWGVRIYRESPPPHLVDDVLSQHDQFYALMSQWIEAIIRAHGQALVLDFHSYNHCKTSDGKPAPQSHNPDIDLGMSTLDKKRFGLVAERFADALSQSQVEGRSLDVRTNVRYPDGGNFPEWVFSQYGKDVCTITIEVKKFYMDEVSGQASLRTVDDLYLALSNAKKEALDELRSRQ